MMMGELFLWGGLFLLTHLGISSTRWRFSLAGFVGEGWYLIGYSVMAILLLSVFVWTYSSVPKYQYMWLPNPDLYWVAKLTMPLSCILLVGGFMVRNPSNVGQSIDQAEDARPLVKGVVCITRHPVQWSIILWGVGHVVANGDLASIFFFSVFVLVSGIGTVLLDHKKTKQFGSAWERYQASTSSVPFWALLQDRVRVKPKELFLPVLAGSALYFLLYYFHEWFAGAMIV
jgi:uncharacterized membrane protein